MSPTWSLVVALVIIFVVAIGATRMMRKYIHGSVNPPRSPKRGPRAPD